MREDHCHEYGEIVGSDACRHGCFGDRVRHSEWWWQFGRLDTERGINLEHGGSWRRDMDLLEGVLADPDVDRVEGRGPLERLCQRSPGRGPKPELSYSATQVTLTIWGIPPRGEVFTCQGNQPTDVTVLLAEPLGTRKVVQGATMFR